MTFAASGKRLGSVQARTREPGTLGERATVVVRDFLDYLEHQFEGGDADIRNLIAADFLRDWASQRTSTQPLELCCHHECRLGTRPTSEMGPSDRTGSVIAQR